MTQSAAGSIDAVLVRQLGIEPRCGVHLSAILEVTRVQIAVDVGAYAVILHAGATAHDELLRIAVGLALIVVAHGIDAHAACAVAIADVARQDERQLEASASDAVLSVIDGGRPVEESIGGAGIAGTRLVLTAYDGLLHILHCEGYDTVEVGSIGHMARHRHLLAGS